MTKTTTADTNRRLLFSVTLDDCEVQHFRSGGKGGQHQNKTDSGTRIIHAPSGARGESREERSQLQNKKKAFRRMADHPAFRFWVHQEAERLKGNITAEEKVEAMLNDPAQLRIEIRDDRGRWVQAPPEVAFPERVHITAGAVTVRS